MSENQPVSRLADRLLKALKSRQVLMTLSALLVALLVLAVPELAAVRGELLMLVITLALVLLGGYRFKDAARLAREDESAPVEEIRDLVKEVLTELVDEMADEDASEAQGEAQPQKENG
jgi:hypothetical protein